MSNKIKGKLLTVLETEIISMRSTLDKYLGYKKEFRPETSIHEMLRNEDKVKYFEGRLEALLDFKHDLNDKYQSIFEEAESEVKYPF